MQGTNCDCHLLTHNKTCPPCSAAIIPPRGVAGDVESFRIELALLCQEHGFALHGDYSGRVLVRHESGRVVDAFSIAAASGVVQ